MEVNLLGSLAHTFLWYTSQELTPEKQQFKVKTLTQTIGSGLELPYFYSLQVCPLKCTGGKKNHIINNAKLLNIKNPTSGCDFVPEKSGISSWGSSLNCLKIKITWEQVKVLSVNFQCD